MAGHIRGHSACITCTERGESKKSLSTRTDSTKLDFPVPLLPTSTVTDQHCYRRQVNGYVDDALEVLDSNSMYHVFPTRTQVQPVTFAIAYLGLACFAFIV